MTQRNCSPSDPERNPQGKIKTYQRELNTILNVWDPVFIGSKESHGTRYEITPKKLLKEVIPLIERNLNKGMNLGRFTEEFDKIYFSYSIDEKSTPVDFMDKLSSTNDNYQEAISPESPCMIFEPRFKEYARNFLINAKHSLSIQDL